MKDLQVVDQYLMIKQLWKEMVQKHDIIDNRRRENVVWRHAFSVACLEYTSLTLQKIGGIISKDHATVLHAQKQHEGNYLYDDRYKQAFIVCSTEIEFLMDKYQDVMQEIVSKRIIELNIDKSVENVVTGYQKRLKRMDEAYKREVYQLNDRIQKLTKQFNIVNERNTILNEELKRVKNLL